MRKGGIYGTGHKCCSQKPAMVTSTSQVAGEVSVHLFDTRRAFACANMAFVLQGGRAEEPQRLAPQEGMHVGSEGLKFLRRLPTTAVHSSAESVSARRMASAKQRKSLRDVLLAGHIWKELRSPIQIGKTTGLGDLGTS